MCSTAWPASFPWLQHRAGTPPIFVFKGEHGAPEGAKRLGGGEGVVHELAKLHLASTKRLSLKIDERVDLEPMTYLNFDFATFEIEFPIHVGEITYWVDLLATLTPESPIPARFGQQIAIEVRDQHAVECEKREDLRSSGLTTIGIQLSQGMHLTFEEAADRRLLADRRRWLGTLFAKPVRAKFLHRRDHVNLAKGRKNAAKASREPQATQHNQPTVPSSGIRPTAPAPQPRPETPPTTAMLSCVVPPPPSPEAQVSSSPQPPASIQTAARTATVHQSQPPAQRKSGLLGRFCGWLNSL